jgi:hypothetical protein
MNAVASWYAKEELPIAYISGEFSRLVVEGICKRAPSRRKRPRPRRS